MAIRVTCAKCLTRFNVSDKFAGQKGPCPKCKTVIEIPKSNEDVKVHAPETFGPKGSDGKGVLQPIFRVEKPVSPVTWAIAIAVIVVLLVISVLGRFQFPNAEEFPLWAMMIGAIMVSFPISFLSYQLLYNRESVPFTGGELFGRVAAVAGGLSLLWVLSPLMAYAFKENMASPGTLSQSISLAGLILAGAGIAVLAFDFDYIVCLLVSGCYLVSCILMRLLAGLTVIPGMKAAPVPKPEDNIEMVQIGVPELFDSISFLLDSVSYFIF